MLGEVAFPREAWNDFAIVILVAWAHALVNLSMGTSEHEDIHFMEGPYVAEISRLAEGRLRVVGIRRDESARTASVEIETDARPLLESVLETSLSALAAGRRAGAWSPDHEELEKVLPALQSELSKLKTGA